MMDMRKIRDLILLLILLVIIGCSKPIQKSDSMNIANINEVSQMLRISSTAFEHNGNIPKKYTCQGDDVNPPLRIEGIPSGAKSLVLIADDPDAPRGDWVHWVVWNISPETRIIEEDSVPSGAIQGMNDFSKTDYGGPCPPSGTHRYFFKVFALDNVLNLPSSSRKPDILRAIQGHVIDKGELVGMYRKS